MVVLDYFMSFILSFIKDYHLDFDCLEFIQIVFIGKEDYGTLILNPFINIVKLI